MTVIEPTSLALTDLQAIHTNLERIRAHVGERKVLAAVKANAYGHGAVAVSRMIQQTQAADWLGVATVSEGLELRDAGITLPILKLSMTRHPDETTAAVAAAITVAVTDTTSIMAVAAAATAAGVVADVHLKIDTGMGRIGCRPEEAVKLAALIDESPALTLGGAFSHLPASDDPGQDAATAAQITLFRDTVAAIETARGPIPLKHLANSGAVLGHPDAWLDLVRPGIIIYGAYPDPAAPRTIPLEPALEWSTYLSFVKRVTAGTTISYGRTWTAPRDTVIGTIPIGYADGYSRLLSNRGRVLVGGRSCPIVGRICMDQAMVDLGPDATDKVGDEVVLVGRDESEEITTTEVAALMGTIPYEMTCLIAPRVTRQYLD